MAAAQEGQLRVTKSSRWGAVPEPLVEDLRLSLSARAVAVWLTIKPDGWVVHISVLLHRVGCSKDLWQRRIAPELEAAGYLTRQRVRNEKGQIRWSHEFFPEGNATIAGISGDGSTNDGKPSAGKPSQLDIPAKINHKDKTTTNQVVEEIDELVEAAVWAYKKGGGTITKPAGFKHKVKARIVGSPTGPSPEDVQSLIAWRASRTEAQATRAQQKVKADLVRDPVAQETGEKLYLSGMKKIQERRQSH